MLQPEDSLVSERLILRPYQNGDEGNVEAFFKKNKNLLKSFIDEEAFKIKDVETASYYLRKTRMGWVLKTFLTFGIWVKQNPKLIGEIVFFNIDWNNGELEIGCYLDKDYQNKGIITESITLCLPYIFYTLNINMIKATSSQSNISMHKSFEKCGFTKGPETLSTKEFSIFK